MQTYLFVILFITPLLHNQVFCDRRFDSNAQDAVLDFINIEGNRRPTPPQPNKPGAAPVTFGVPKTSQTTSTTPSTPTGTKQLVKHFNDKIAENAGNPNPTTPGNRNPTPTRQNSQGNREQFPALGTPSTRPGGSTNAWGPSNNNQNRDYPGLPNNSPTTGGTTAKPTTQKSWSSVVSGGPGHVLPNSGLTVKSTAPLQPIVPGAPLPPAAPTTPVVEVISDIELKNLSETLFRKDTNNAGKFITINYQGRTSSFSKDDLAPQPLMTIEKGAWDLPTIAAMKALLDNYEQDTTVNEHVTAQEKNEENAFIDAVMATPVIRHLMTVLKDKNLVSLDPKEQKDVLKSIWFNMYSRGQGRIGSSGFEHIFLSELKAGEISGLHNWLYFNTQEEANNINYLGYLKKLDIGDKQSILKLHFNMKGIDKPVDTMFVGTTPELEVALYSLCFLTRADRACPLSLGGKDFNLRTHTFRYRSKNMIGSAFPEI